MSAAQLSVGRTHEAPPVLYNMDQGTATHEGTTDPIADVDGGAPMADPPPPPLDSSTLIASQAQDVTQ